MQIACPAQEVQNLCLQLSITLENELLSLIWWKYKKGGRGGDIDCFLKKKEMDSLTSSEKSSHKIYLSIQSTHLAISESKQEKN